MKGEFKKWKGGCVNMNGKKRGIIRTALDDRKKFFVLHQIGPSKLALLKTFDQYLYGKYLK